MSFFFGTRLTPSAGSFRKDGVQKKTRQLLSITSLSSVFCAPAFLMSAITAGSETTNSAKLYPLPKRDVVGLHALQYRCYAH